MKYARGSRQTGAAPERHHSGFALYAKRICRQTERRHRDFADSGQDIFAREQPPPEALAQ
jgi:hypothetical protein